MKYLLVITSLLMILLNTGCAPEVGSKAWCEKISEKPKGDWTANELKGYAQHCLFGNNEE